MAAPRKAGHTSHPIYEKAQSKWQSSGLTDDHADLLLLRPLTGDEVLAELKGDKPQPCGVQIPYFDFQGTPTEFFRIRYLEPPPGFAGLVEKPQRYAQPAKTLNEIYMPPLLPTPWADVAEDPSVPIYITEGEFKAACACSHGLPCIGLGGVDVFRSTKRGIALLPQLEQIQWKNRNVIIVFDSDAAKNPNVVRAQRSLAGVLLAKGALPAVASLPPAAGDGGKQGLDDLLVAEGPDALLQILQDAPRFPEAAALWELNEEVIYIRNPGLVIEVNTGHSMDPGRFASHHYANRHYIETAPNTQGVLVSKRKKLAPRWIEWEHRAEAPCIVYEPGSPHRTEDGSFNTWPGWGCLPKKGDISVWKWLLDHAFRNDAKGRKYFEQWCAYPLQHPGAKMFAYALLWSVEQGTGKSFISYTLKGIYGQNGIEVGNDALRAGFNAWQENKQLVIGDEITAGEARIDADKLKRLICQPEIRVNQKFLPEYRVRDCINYIFNSNHPDALFIEDRDRRGFIHRLPEERLSDEFRDRADLWLNSKPGVRDQKGPGPAHVFHHLLGVDLTGFDPGAPPPFTMDKEAMIINGKSDVGLWIMKLKEDPTTVLRPLTEKVAKGCDLFTTRQLLHAYDPERNSKVAEPGMGRALSGAGFRHVYEGRVTRTALGLVRLVAVRNSELWMKATHKEITTHFNQFFGPEGSKY